MKIYLASNYEEQGTMRAWRSFLQEAGHQVTSSWFDQPEKMDEAMPSTRERSIACAERDIQDIKAANVFVLHNARRMHCSYRAMDMSFHQGRGGRHTEFGIALTLGKPCILVGERENVFHHLAAVHVVERIEDVLPILASLVDTSEPANETAEAHLTAAFGSYLGEISDATFIDQATHITAIRAWQAGLLAQHSHLEELVRLVRTEGVEALLLHAEEDGGASG
jgi:hypothetical protein